MSRFSYVPGPLRLLLCELFVINFTGSHSNPMIPHLMVSKERFLRGRLHEQFIAHGYVVGLSADGNL